MNYKTGLAREQIEMMYCLGKMVEDVFSNTSNFMTIHKSKGQEFRSVLLNTTPAKDELKCSTLEKALATLCGFSENNEVDNFYKYARLVYAGASRAINNLYVCGSYKDKYKYLYQRTA